MTSSRKVHYIGIIPYIVLTPSQLFPDVNNFMCKGAFDYYRGCDCPYSPQRLVKTIYYCFTSLYTCHNQKPRPTQSILTTRILTCMFCISQNVTQSLKPNISHCPAILIIFSTQFPLLILNEQSIIIRALTSSSKQLPLVAGIYCFFPPQITCSPTLFVILGGVTFPSLTTIIVISKRNRTLNT